MKKNEHGSSSLIITLVIIIIGLIITIGWLISSKNNSKKTNNNSQNTNQNNNQNRVINTGSNTLAYTLPENWDQKSCPENTFIIADTRGNALNCDSRNNNILISQNPVALSDDDLPVCLTKKDLDAASLSKPISNYTCSKTTIDGKDVILEDIEQGSRDQGEYSHTLSYIFLQDKPVYITYFSAVDGSLPNRNEFEQIANSIDLN